MSSRERLRRYLQEQREREFNRLHPKDQRRLQKVGRAVNKRVSPITGRARRHLDSGVPKGKELVHGRTRKALEKLTGYVPGKKRRNRK